MGCYRKAIYVINPIFLWRSILYNDRCPLRRCPINQSWTSVLFPQSKIFSLPLDVRGDFYLDSKTACYHKYMTSPGKFINQPVCKPETAETYLFKQGVLIICILIFRPICQIPPVVWTGPPRWTVKLRFPRVTREVPLDDRFFFSLSFKNFPSYPLSSWSTSSNSFTWLLEYDWT